MSTLQEQFTLEVESFLEHHGMDPGWFGRQALNDNKFVAQLRAKNRAPTLRTVEKVRAWMAQYPERATAQ